MKKLLLSVAALLFTAGMLVAQSSDPELDYIKAAYSRDKKVIVDEYLKLSTENRDKFAKLYDEFEMERTKLASGRLALLEEYASKVDSLKDAYADSFAKAVLENTISLDKLNLKFYNKMKQDLGAINAAKFFQLEIYLQTTWRGIVQDNIPFIGELDKSQKPTPTKTNQ
jgi:hypothetical protein